MKKILCSLIVLQIALPVYSMEIEERGAVKILSKEEVQKVKRSEDILDWKQVKVKKGYILSNDLYYQQRCSPTWDIHVKEFKKENPQVKNPNILSIDEIIKVQTCYEKDEPFAPIAKKEESVPTPKKEKDVDFFGLVSGQFNKSNSGEGNKSSEGQGLKLDIGKYFHLSSDRKLKASLGILFNETKVDDSADKNKKIATTADLSYLFKVNEKMSLGPNLELFSGSGFKDYQKSRKDSFSGFAGLNLDYKLSNKYFLDLKVLNALENRMNINTSFGLGINF